MAMMTLEDAWNAVAAAMPAGWRFLELSPYAPDENEPAQMAVGIHWCAQATEAPLEDIGGSGPVYEYTEGVTGNPSWDALFGNDTDRPYIVSGDGDTHIEALADLAANLRREHGKSPAGQ